MATQQTDPTSEIEIHSLPGNFAKIVKGDRTMLRVHALVDGSWVDGKNTMRWTGEKPAVSWLVASAVAMALNNN